MAILGSIGRGVAWLMTTVAKAIGGMSGKTTYDNDVALRRPDHRQDYRP
jgi:hypothetical protein